MANGPQKAWITILFALESTNFIVMFQESVNLHEKALLDFHLVFDREHKCESGPTKRKVVTVMF